jgi:Carboxypeptidase regulatory-like domain
MSQRGVLISILVVGVLGGAVWWWTSRGSDPPATQSVTQAGGSGSQAARPAPRAKPAPASLEVTVSDARGPIGNAAVRLAPEDGEVLVVRTGPDGSARADRLEPGEWQISASAAGHEPAAAKPQALAAGAAAKVAIMLQSGGRPLTGVVTDVSGGPIAGARIDAAKLTLERPDRAIATAVTGADGRYELAVPEGQLLVAARSPDYAAQSRPVEVGAAGATADFALVPGSAIEGVVLDEGTRQPVPGAVVGARRERAGRSMIALAEAGRYSAVSGEGGRFRISGLRPGVYELSAGAEGRRTRSDTVVGIGVAEQVAGVELLVGTGPVIRGVVLDEQSAPVPGAKVFVAARGDRDNEATADEKGAFVLEGLGAGSFRLFARGDAILPAAATPVELKDRDVDGVIVRVQQGLTIKGHVEPRQVAEVRFEPDDEFRGVPLPGRLPRSIVTGPDGSFEIRPVGPGKATLSARCPSGDQGSVAVTAAGPVTEVVLQVSPGGAIAGRVTDGDGKPVAGVTVVASPTGVRDHTTVVNGVITSGVQGLTGATGAYELRGLSAGAYRVSALERGKPARVRGKPPQVTLAAVDKGTVEKKTGVDFSIDRANGVIKGVVVGPDGKPLADAWVSVQQDLGAMLDGMLGVRGPRRGGGPGPGGGGPGAGGGPGGPGPGGGPVSRMVTFEASDDDGGGGASEVPPALTDAQGRFEIRGLARSEYEVIAEAQAGKLRGRASDVTPDATLTIQAMGLTTLSGTVRGPRGPAALFTVELEGPTRAQRTFADGKFELGRVDPGSYVVRVRSSDGNADQPVEVAPGTPATVDVTLAPNAVVVGTIVDGAGKPLPGVPLAVVDQEGDMVKIAISGPPPTSGPDGKFRVEHKAGPSALVVLVPPQPITKRGLMLEAGKTLDVGEVRVEARPPGGPAPGGGSGSGGLAPGGGPSQLASSPAIAR